MPEPTLDQVLEYVQALPADEQDLLAELLHKRRIEAWREETAQYARESARAFQAGHLKSLSAKKVTARLRASLDEPDA